MSKRIGRSSIIGEQGIAHIRRTVLDMGYMFYETGGVEAGIDGYIELRDQETGQVSNLILQVQGKATERERLPAETPDSFEWPCTEADIRYWRQGTAPVLLIVVQSLRLQGYSSIDTGMEWAWSVEVRATRRFPFWERRVLRGSPWRLRCYPRRSRKLSTEYVRRLPGARRVESAGCGGQPRLETPDPGIGLLAPWGQRFGSSTDAAVSRASVARQCARCGAAVDADGGGRPNTSGTMGSGARNIVANSAGRSTLRWRAVRTTLARTCWVSAPLRVRLPPQTLRMTTAGRMACSARQLVASTDGCHRKVKRAPNSVARCAAKRSASSCGGGLSISRLIWASSRPRAVARPWSLIPPALRRSRSARAACKVSCTWPAHPQWG